jgi:hypothetical protein
MGALHKCEGLTPKAGYGNAVTDCIENEDDTLWVGNDEYGSQVGFCPYCGFKAKKMPPIEVASMFGGARRGTPAEKAAEQARLEEIFTLLGYAVVR